MPDLASIPTAPASTDNATVILWVVAVLIVVVIFLVRHLFAKIAANEAKAEKAQAECRAENAKAYAEVEKRDATILTITLGQQQSAMATANAIGSMTDAVKELTTTLKKNSDSGMYRSRG